MKLAGAILNVARYFIKVSFVVSNKWSAIVALSVALYSIYAPRFTAYNERMAREAKARTQPAPPIDSEIMVAG
jgi:hypothetical protein